MKKFWLMLVTIGSLMGFTTADAREFFGIRLGFPELGVQLGSTSVFGRNVGGRLTADFGYGNSSGYGLDKRYSTDWGQIRFRCA